MPAMCTFISLGHSALSKYNIKLSDGLFVTQRWNSVNRETPAGSAKCFDSQLSLSCFPLISDAIHVHHWWSQMVRCWRNPSAMGLHGFNDQSGFSAKRWIYFVDERNSLLWVTPHWEWPWVECTPYSDSATQDNYSNSFACQIIHDGISPDY